MKTSLMGLPINLQGTPVVVGKKIPHFSLTDTKGNTINHLTFMGKRVILNTFPDIKTEVCDLQTRTMIKRVREMDNVVLVNLSTNSKDDFDRWCANEGLDSIMISDPKGEYARRLGLRLPLIGKYARAVILINEEGEVDYIEVTDKITAEPNYNQIIGRASK